MCLKQNAAERSVKGPSPIDRVCRKDYRKKMKKTLTVVLILAMVMALAACGKKEEPSNQGNPETTKAAEVTKEAETTNAPEVTKEEEPTKAPETTPEATPEATPTPVEVIPDPTAEPDVDPEEDEFDEFADAGTEFDGLYVSDTCTLMLYPEGTADIIDVYYGKNSNRNEWEDWYEYWLEYSLEDQTFTSAFGYHKYTDPDKETEAVEETATFVATGDKIIWVEQGYMEFRRTSEEDFYSEDPVREVDALGNESWVMDVDKSEMRARILGYTEFLEDNYLAIFDFYEQYKLPYDDLAGKNIGDVVEVNGKNVLIVGFYSLDDSGDFSIENDSYTDGCRVVVIPENPEEFYTQIQLDAKGYYFDPEYANFGFVLCDDGMFYGYDDWAWDDCYVPEQYVALSLVKLVVSPDTLVELAYSFGEDGDMATLSGTQYLDLRNDPEGQEALGVHIYEDVEVYVSEITDESGRSTGEVGLISEIYSP